MKETPRSEFDSRSQHNDNYERFGIGWEDVYKNTKSIRDVPWEIGKPSPELSRLVESKIIKPCKALDVGCGFGTHSIFLAKKGFEVKAFDISETAIGKAKQRARKMKANVDFFVGDVTKIDFKEKFGFVFDRGCFHTLERKDRGKYLKNLLKFLEPKGKFYLGVFSDKNPPGPGPYRFSKEKIEKIFSPFFKILEVKEIVHKEKSKISFIPGNTRYLFSILMEKKS